MARSAGKLITTSPSWPKSMMRILRGLKSMLVGRPGSLRSLQMLVKKVCPGVVRTQPVFVQQKIMNFVRVNDLFKVNIVRAQPTYQIDRLRELNVAIVIGVNQ